MDPIYFAQHPAPGQYQRIRQWTRISGMVFVGVILMIAIQELHMMHARYELRAQQKSVCSTQLSQATGIYKTLQERENRAQSLWKAIVAHAHHTHIPTPLLQTLHKKLPADVELGLVMHTPTSLEITLRATSLPLILQGIRQLQSCSDCAQLTLAALEQKDPQTIQAILKRTKESSEGE